MTNWPNIQEYRNFEAKFIDDPKHNVINDSAANNDVETVVKDDIAAKTNEVDLTNNEKLQNFDSKIVRCVIKKDFEETFKKVEREDGIHEYPRSKPQEVAVADRLPDKIRLQNHLKWKKQKEEEYLQKKEAEKIALKKKNEEEERLEKLKKQKEKEKMEKLKEWQEQKAREKEEKKKEKMMIKMLEELKVTPSVDKEKLLEEWVKLKNKQKQIETEKKAEQLKKEEESRALRQTLADLSYRQWKERVKGRMMTLPKNGYQIFGPKPVPVVKEDWNHDFIYSSPRSPHRNLRNQESTTTLTFCSTVKDLDDLSRDLFYLGDLKTRTPNIPQLKRMKSGLNLTDSISRKGRCEMPLKELQPESVDFNNKGEGQVKNGFQKTKNFPSNGFNSEMSFLSQYMERDNNLTDLLCFPGAQGDQNQCYSSSKKKPLDLLNNFPDAQILPNKKKIDLYINTCPDNVVENSALTVPEKKKVTNNDSKLRKEVKKPKIEKKPEVETTKNTSNEKISIKNRIRSLSLQKFDKNSHKSSEEKKPTGQDNVKIKPCRRTQSCEKSEKKIHKNEPGMKNCSSSKSMIKVVGTGVESRKSLTKSKTNCSQKRKSKKTEVIQSKSEKKLCEPELKNKKKFKRKNSLSKSFSFIDSPYCSKTCPKILNKTKTNRKRNTKDIETKSDEGGRCRNLSTTKI